MTDDRRSEETILEHALTFGSKEARNAYLQGACGDNSELRARVESLIEAHVAVGGFLKPVSGGSTILVEPRPEEGPGNVIGHYKLLQQIGEGGCGVVFMAEQEKPIRRRVAFKVIKLGMDTKQVIARFEAERQALALMDHPNIAKVFDAGATETGRPYFAMELVKGIPITRYCDENHLDTRQRLSLLILVCQAVQHAHQKGIIHRDIKPSNILVADHDAVPVPKVIDFGIAKATTDQPLTDKTLFTAFEQFVGTPAYMSPEQAKLSGLDIDTRSDIYSLGVLFYELLTGKTPFDAKRLVEAGLDEIRRIIREEDPPRPSTRLSTLDVGEQTKVANHRHSAPPKLFRIVQGDLDWIVMKTLEKDRNRRYETANDLAMDIDRFLRNEPVMARPPSLVYRSGKLLRKRRREVTLGVLVVASLAWATAFGLQHRHAKALRYAAELSQLRREESQVLSRAIAGLAPREDKSLAQSYLSRLAERVRAGSGSTTDHELLARFLTRNVSLRGRSLQTVDQPSITLESSTGAGYFIKGVGAILRPLVALEGTEVPVEHYPVYLSSGPGGELSSSVAGPVGVQAALNATGIRSFSSILEAQLVHAKDATAVRSDIKPSDYEPIGTPIRIVLPSFDRCFLRQLPPQYPLELVDDRAARQVTESLAISHARLIADRIEGTYCELEMLVPQLSPPLPVALRVDLVQIGDTRLQAWLCGLVVDQNSVATMTDGDGVKTLGMTISSDGAGNWKYGLNFTLPEIKSPKPGEPPLSGQIRVRSSREVALRTANLEHFLSLPQVGKTLLFTVNIHQDR